MNRYNQISSIEIFLINHFSFFALTVLFAEFIKYKDRRVLTKFNLENKSWSS